MNAFADNINYHVFGDVRGKLYHTLSEKLWHRLISPERVSFIRNFLVRAIRDEKGIQD